MSEKEKCDLKQECQSCNQSNKCSEEEKQAHREKLMGEKLSHIEHKLMVMSVFLCPLCGKGINLFKVGGGEKAALELKVPFLGRIPLDPEIVQNCDQGKPFVAVNPDSRAAKAFYEITE